MQPAAAVPSPGPAAQPIGGAFWSKRLQEGEIREREIPRSLVTLAGALISTLVEELLAKTSRLLGGHGRTVLCRSGRRIGERERCRRQR